jgi:cytochrome c oxidase subunit 2
MAFSAAACSADDTGPQLSELAEAGRSIAAESGCAGCHGDRGQGGVGPAWVQLAGSLVELEDGSTVTADGSYLRTAIVDPSADLVAGYTVRMPQVELTEAEVDALVAYIEELR